MIDAYVDGRPITNVSLTSFTKLAFTETSRGGGGGGPGRLSNAAQAEQFVEDKNPP